MMLASLFAFLSRYDAETADRAASGAAPQDAAHPIAVGSLATTTFQFVGAKPRPVVDTTTAGRRRPRRCRPRSSRACSYSRYFGVLPGGEERAACLRSWRVRMTDDRAVRAALERHWAASDAGDFEVEHDIYRDDAVLDYPQSGERIRGRRNIQESRFVQPNKKRFKVRRIIGSGDLWVTEFVLSYDGVPSYTVSIMEFRDGLVAHETQYFADHFDPAPSRAHLVERMGETTS
jgi:hypothetical protein